MEFRAKHRVFCSGGVYLRLGFGDVMETASLCPATRGTAKACEYGAMEGGGGDCSPAIHRLSADGRGFGLRFGAGCFGYPEGDRVAAGFVLRQLLCVTNVGGQPPRAAPPPGIFGQRGRRLGCVHIDDDAALDLTLQDICAEFGQVGQFRHVNHFV